MELKIVLLNCFLLHIPILLYNAVFFRKITKVLPSDRGINPWLLKAEHVFRFFIFSLPLFMPMHQSSSTLVPGFIIYLTGSLIYFASWIPHLMPQRFKYVLSQSIVIFLGPFFTPLFFLSGIALIGTSITYMVIALLFVCIHTTHGFLTYKH